MNGLLAERRPAPSPPFRIRQGAVRPATLTLDEFSPGPVTRLTQKEE